MSRKKKIFISLAGTLTVIGVIALGLPLLARSSNCGGNSAALNNCKQILTYAQWFGDMNSFLPKVERMEPEDRRHFATLNASHWTGSAQYWVRTNGVNSPDSKQIVVFCDQPFDNVPQPRLGNLYKRTPAYADGTAGLIAPDVFSQFPKSDFAPLSALKQIYQP